MKNKGIIITLIIILVIITIGLIAFLALCLSGKFNFINMIRNGRKSTNLIIDETFESADITSITVTSQAGDITFEESTTNEIRVVIYGNDKDKCSVNNTYGTIKINSSSESSWGFFNFNNYINDIIVYIPKDFSNEITIKNNFGDCDILGLENASVDIELDCGDIKLDEIKNAKINSNLGDIKIGNILNSCTLESSCGDIDINNMNIKENSSIKSDLGDVKVRDASDVYVDAKVDLGDIKIRDNNRHSEITLRIESDCGDIKVGE